MDKIKKIFSTKFIAGLVIGGILGYLYYYFIGCNSGTCPITLSPVMSVIWGILLGGIVMYK